MSPSLALYIALTVTLAAWIVAHAALVLRVLRVRAMAPGRRALALIPPATPVLAWKSGIRTGVIVWSVLLLAYVALQVAAQV